MKENKSVAESTNLELGAPPVNPVAWVGWSRSNPNRVGRCVTKLWYDARNMIARELHVINLQELEVVQVADSVFGTSDDSK
jgi:hypothetical protein